MCRAHKTLTVGAVNEVGLEVEKYLTPRKDLAAASRWATGLWTWWIVQKNIAKRSVRGTHRESYWTDYITASESSAREPDTTTGMEFLPHLREEK